MKRDWDVIREVLIEVEGMSFEQAVDFVYETPLKATNAAQAKAQQALLLQQSGFLSGTTSNLLDGTRRLLQPQLTWEGHELLGTLRSKPVWERIKATAQEKGIELTFDTVITLGKAAVAWLIAQAS